MAEYTEWSQDLEDALSRPFPPDCVQQLKKGSASISFVPWHHYARKLNHLVGPGWSMGEPIVREIAGKLVIGVPVTIFGVTRVNFGDEDEGKDDYGTASTNAWAQSFKRTCALFGMGLDMYDKGRGAARAPQPAQRQAPRTDRAPAPAQTHHRADGPKPASEKQLAMIDRLVVERDLDFHTREQLQTEIGSLTSIEASEWITRLKGLPVMEKA